MAGPRRWRVLCAYEPDSGGLQGGFCVCNDPNFHAIESLLTTLGRYGKLDGPLIELEFATISRVRVGFGYNYAIRMPDVTELTSFPLITDAGLQGAGNNPSVVLEAIRSSKGGSRPFVFPRENSLWFAAGMTITAFDTLTLTAVLIMDIDTTAGPDSGVAITLLADGIFQMEPLSPPSQSLFYIELVVKVEFNFAHGYIAADTVLAPSSHVFVPGAHASFFAFYIPADLFLTISIDIERA